MKNSLILKINKHYMYYVDCFLVYAFLALTLYIFLFQYSQVFLNIRYIFLVLAAIRGYYVSIKERFWLPVILAWFFLLSFLLCWIFLGTSNIGVNSFTYTILYIGLAVLLLEGRFGIIGSGGLLLFAMGVIGFRYLQGVNPNALLTRDSRNYISVLLLLAIILFYLAIYKENMQFKLWMLLPAFIYFVLSGFAYGRGGIITSAFILFAFSWYFSFQTEKKSTQRLVRIFAFVVIIITIIVVFLNYDEARNILGKFNVEVTSRERLEYWREFFENNLSSVGNFIFGSDASKIRLDRNLHNSYLQCYASYGLFAFLLVIILCINFLGKSLKKKNYIIAILATTLFIRAFTDKLFFQGYNEVYLYYFIMFWSYEKLKNKRVVST